MADGGWLVATFAFGAVAGAALVTVMIRRRGGHVRMEIEVGDPPTETNRRAPPS